MRITPKQFALSLYEAADGKSASQVKAIIAKFIEILVKNNALSMAEKIEKEFLKIWNERQGIVEAEIITAHGLGREIMKMLKDYLGHLTKAKEVVVHEKEDKNILGGVVIRYGDKILDGSLRSQLAELKEKLIK
ncbi:MAG: ATP synthase F1 subunit delta [Patescibacteria group bacterium]|nr:ATP synthase F1 subunit delta [Patescibacteria group bacterium]